MGKGKPRRDTPPLPTSPPAEIGWRQWDVKIDDEGDYVDVTLPNGGWVRVYGNGYTEVDLTPPGA